MPAASQWDEGLVQIATFAKVTDFSTGFIRKLFDAGDLPGMRVDGQRRVLGGFMTDLFAAIRFGGSVVDLKVFAAEWKAAQASKLGEAA